MRNPLYLLGAASCALLLATGAQGEVLTPPPANARLAHDLFRDIVEVRSVHDIGTAQVAKIIVKYLKAGGFSDRDIVVVPEAAHPNQVNVIVRIKGRHHGDPAYKPVMWMGHMDVVDAKADDWSVPPFKFTGKNGWFYGRGTSDMKDEDAAMAASMIRLHQEHYVPERDIIAAFTADEEVGQDQDGPEYLLTHDPKLIDAGLIINPDGGSGEILDGKRIAFGIETVQKIYVTYDATVTNRGGHSSEPRPDNAIYELAGDLTKLSRYSFPFKTNTTTRLYFARMAQEASGQRRTDMLALSRETEVDIAAAQRLAKDPAFNAILHTTCVATMLKAGVQENALPSRATATIQCRVMPDETPAETEAALKTVMADPKLHFTSLTDVTTAPESPPRPALLEKVASVVHSMWPGVPVVPEMAAGASDSIFTRKAGIPSYGIGGGWNDLHDLRMHGRNERMRASTFYQTVELTYRLMKSLAG
ncbi:MAG: M20/M25/M40 family metallo-hydrolase [Alphaproteobacteria bacterium]|nr:M20/M25/M40 family metallo-hydrolase [Alphaproteobacteria bacterium]